MTTATQECVCKSEFQDKVYGKNKRLHNRINSPIKHGGNNWRCTVCGRQCTHAKERMKK